MARTPIRAAVLESPGEPLEIRQVYIDDPLPGEVSVRALAAGLCHSDLHYVDGTLPIALPAVLGHEISGEIVAVGAGVSADRIGDRVVVTITPSCGQCTMCVRGLATQCERSGRGHYRDRPKLTDGEGRPLHLLGAIGGFAERIVVNEAAAVPVDLEIPAVEACLLGCCVATGFGAVAHGAKVSPLDSVAVIGCGGVGIAAIQAAKIAGARTIVAIDVHEQKLERARTFGATHGLISDELLTENLQRICPGGIDRSFEAVGSPHTAALAFEILSPSGLATILGLEPPGSTIQIDAGLLIEGDRRLQGAYMGANQLPRDIQAFSAHRATGDLQLHRMVTSRWHFEDINKGFAAMLAPDAIRSVIAW